MLKKYNKVEISEKQLEDIVRKYPYYIENELTYIDHQRRTDRGPLDSLLADSGKAMVVAELKVTEDDGMLVQGMDYYDFIVENIEGFARAYGFKKIDPLQKVRLFLIAPSFSVALLNRCKWIDIPISLFTFQCIAFEDNPETIIPVFQEITIPTKVQSIEVYTIEQRISYITDKDVKLIVEELLEEIKGWDKDSILVEPIKYYISVKVSGRVIFYLAPRRKHFIISTYNNESKWTDYPIYGSEDLKDVKILLRTCYEKYI